MAPKLYWLNVIRYPVPVDIEDPTEFVAGLVRIAGLDIHGLKLQDWQRPPARIRANFVADDGRGYALALDCRTGDYSITPEGDPLLGPIEAIDFIGGRHPAMVQPPLTGSRFYRVCLCVVGMWITYEYSPEAVTHARETGRPLQV